MLLLSLIIPLLKFRVIFDGTEIPVVIANCEEESTQRVRIFAYFTVIYYIFTKKNIICIALLPFNF